MPELTKNEEILLLSILHLKKDAYGVYIRHHIKESTGKQYNYGTLYRMLDQLVKKELLERKEGEPMPEKGGRRKNYYSLTESGAKILQEAYNFQRSLWNTEAENALKRLGLT